MSPDDADGMANSVDPDQTAPLGTVWSGSALFAQAYLSENLGSLRYVVGTYKNHLVVFEPPHDKTNQMACAPSEDSDQPGHPPSLIRVFAVHLKKARILSYPKERSDWAQMPFCWFCHEAAHFSSAITGKAGPLALSSLDNINK